MHGYETRRALRSGVVCSTLPGVDETSRNRRDTRQERLSDWGSFIEIDSGLTY